MNELRWILIGFGIVLLAAIYLWGRRGNRAVAAGDDALLRARPEPRDAQSASRRWCAPVEDSDRRVCAARRRRAPAEPPPGRTRIAAPRRHLARPARADVRRCSDRRAARATRQQLRPSAAAPTLSSSEAPQSRRVERRKILSLRLAIAPQRLEGAKLLESLLAESLQHGKYDIFHRAAHRRQHRFQRREHGRARHVRPREDERDALSRHHDVHAASRTRCRACMR